MADAWIIDACRTPRGIGKAGKGALSGIHPQQLGATVLRALAERNGIDTADVDDIIWGTSAQLGPQSGDLGRMSALDAGYDVRASGVTLDRFCGSGITAPSWRRNAIMAGMEDLVIAGGTEMMSMEGRRRRRPVHDGRRQPAPARPASAVASGRLRRRDRDAGRHHARGRRRLGLESQQRAAHAIANGHFDKSLVPVYREDGSLALDHEEYPRPQTTLEGLAALKPAFPAMADYPLDDKGTTYRNLILQKHPGPRDRPRPSRRQFVGRGRRLRGGPAGVAGLRQGARPEAARPRGRDRQHGRLPDADAERAGAGGAEGAGAGRA